MAKAPRRKPGRPRKHPDTLFDTPNWSKMETREALAYWLALPTKGRTPKLQKELAQELGVSQERLCQIKKDPDFFKKVEEYRRIFFKQYTTNVIDSIREKAESGDPRAQKLWLQYVEDWKETTRQEKDVTERRELVMLLGDDKMAETMKLIGKEFKAQQRKYLEENIPEAEIVDEEE